MGESRLAQQTPWMLRTERLRADFCPRTQTLLTSASEGKIWHLLLWPVPQHWEQRTNLTAGNIVLGPPHKLPVPPHLFLQALHILMEFSMVTVLFPFFQTCSMLKHLCWHQSWFANEPKFCPSWRCCTGLCSWSSWRTEVVGILRFSGKENKGGCLPCC